MALQQLDPRALHRLYKRRKKNERRVRKMENAVRRSLYLNPLAKIVEALARLVRPGR
jgi:hypothetical protein